jgi:hypothetical protein
VVAGAATVVVAAAVAAAAEVTAGPEEDIRFTELANGIRVGTQRVPGARAV